MPPDPRRVFRGATHRAVAIGLLAGALAACGSGNDAPAGPPRGEPVATVQTGRLAKAEIDARFDVLPGLNVLAGGPSRCDVSVHRIVYETVAPDAGAARASAGLAMPEGCDGPYPVLVYHHGTEARRASTMSDPTNGETVVNVAFFAAHGYVVVMPDYHGYAESTLDWHPYLHAENTAAVSIDALRAARRVLEQRQVPTSAKLFLWGYSQGGHAAMATQRTIERDHATEFALTATSPASGPYALAWMVDEVFRSPTYGSSVFAPLLLVGLQKAYGDVYASPAEVFQSPWDAGVESLLPGTVGLGELVELGMLPPVLTGTGGLLTAGFVASYLGDELFPARRRVVQNDLRGWSPRTPTKMCGGSRDEIVPFHNATLAQAGFAALGAPTEAFDVESDERYRRLIDQLLRLGADTGDYHAGVVPLLCASVAKLTVFDPRR